MKQTVQVEVDTTKVEQESYKKGLDEAWEFARKIASNESHGGYSITAMCEIFGCPNISKIFEDNSYTEAIAKLRDYEARKKAEAEAVKVGDEVITDGGTRFAVTFVYDDGKRCAGYDSDGKHCGIQTAYCHNTGRNFPEIAAVLEQMKGE